MSHSRKWYQEPDWWTLLVGIVTLVIFYYQFDQMRAQTGLLNTQAQQAAKDSAEAANRTTEQLKKTDEQLKIARDQANAAQDSAKALQRQMNETRKQFEEQERPWITVENVSIPSNGDLLLGKSKWVPIQTVLQVSAKNIGHSPAVNVGLFATLGCCNSLEDGAVKDICKSNGYGGGMGDAVFPDQPWRQDGLALVLSDADKIKYWKLEPGQRNLMVLGCVTYRSTASTEYYYTGFSYWLQTPSTLTPETTEVPAGSMSLMKAFGLVVK